MLCRDFSLVYEHDAGRVAIPLCCRAWNCDYCAPNRRREVIALAMAGAPERMITLTVNPRFLGSPLARAKALANAWRLICKRVRRRWPERKLDYLCVFERTKLGEPHLHILVRSGYIPQAWLSQQAKELIASPIVDIRKIDRARSAGLYVAKYIGKDPHRFGTTKRYWHSKNWVNRQDDPANDREPRRWKIVEEPLWALQELWQRQASPLDHVVLEGDTLYIGTRPAWLAAGARAGPH